MFEIDADDPTDLPAADGSGDEDVLSLQQELERYKRRISEMTQSGFEMITIQAHLQSLLHNATVGIIAFNPDGTVQTFNRAAQQIFGYAEAEVLGHPIPHLIPVHNRDFGNVAQYLKEFIATRATVDTPIVGKHRDGGKLLLYISSGEAEGGQTDLFDDDPFDLEPATAQSAIQTVFFLRDVTKDKQLETELRDKSAKLQQEIEERREVERSLTYEHRLHEVLVSLLKHETSQSDSLEDCLAASMQVILKAPFIAFPDYRLYLLDEASGALEIFLQASERVSAPDSCQRIAPGECLCGYGAARGEIVFAPAGSPLVDASRQPAIPCARYVVPIRVEAQLLGLFLVYLAPGWDYDPLEERFLHACALVLADTIQRKRFEQAVLNAKEAAVRANHAKSEFLANMSHEMRTPMHSILSFAHLGTKHLESGRTEKLGQYFARVKESGERLLMLLNDLLDLSKLEAGKMRIAFEDNDLLALIHSVLGELEGKLEERHLRVEIDAEDLDPRARFDRDRIAQVLVNLLSNAIKFAPEGSALHIALAGDRLREGRRKSDQRELEALRLSIRDEGPGIPEDELESVFDKFVQSSKTKTGAGGTGLGLAICREIVEAHHGHIWAESPEGEGATIRFTIPRQPPPHWVEREP